MRRPLLILFLTGLFFSGVNAQEPIHSYLPFSAYCPGPIVVQVTVGNFEDVASASLSFHYDTLALTYQGFQNINPALTTGMHIVNAVHGQILFSWFSLNPATIGDGVLFELLFYSHASANTALTWDTLQAGQCIYTDENGNEIESKFHDGYINNTLNPPALLSPVSQTNNLPLEITFQWTVCECDAIYEFQLAKDSTFLVIDQSFHGLIFPEKKVTNLEFNTTYYWRVRAGNQEDTSVWSVIYKFRTKGPDAIEDLDRNQVHIHNLSYVPSESVIRFSLQSEIPIKMSATLTDLNGRLVSDTDWGTVESGISDLVFPLNTRAAFGFYNLTFEIIRLESKFQVVKKIRL